MAKAKKESASTPKQAAAEQKKAGRIKTTANDLGGIAYRLREAAEAIDAQAEKMRAHRIDAIDVLGHDGVNRAFDKLNSFLSQCVNKIKQF